MRCHSRCLSLRCTLARCAGLASAALILVVPMSFAASQTVERAEMRRSVSQHSTKQATGNAVRSGSVITMDSVPTMVVSTNGRIYAYVESEAQGLIAGTGACGEVTHAEPSVFEGGTYNIQQGFAENELAMNSLKTWRFEPLPQGNTTVQRGIVTFVFKVR